MLTLNLSTCLALFPPLSVSLPLSACDSVATFAHGDVAFDLVKCNSFKVKVRCLLHLLLVVIVVTVIIISISIVVVVVAAVESSTNAIHILAITCTHTHIGKVCQ